MKSLKRRAGRPIAWLCSRAWPSSLSIWPNVGGVEVENHLRRRMLVRIEEQIDKRCFDRLWVVADLVIGGRDPMHQPL
jgi:hypothetical protein